MKNQDGDRRGESSQLHFLATLRRTWRSSTVDYQDLEYVQIRYIASRYGADGAAMCAESAPVSGVCLYGMPTPPFFLRAACEGSHLCSAVSSGG